MRLPDFIIIGAMKCATSMLYEQMALQPGIFLSRPKEPNFFSNDEIYARGMSWYRHLFEQSEQSDVTGEASTHYTKLPTYPNTVERIQKHAPDAKFIYVMRHPVDRLISHYIHEWSQNEIHCDINQAIQQYSELIEYSRYYYQLLPYVRCFGENNILPVFFERMISYPQLELERVCAFIGYKGAPVWHDIAKQNVSRERVRKFAGYELLIENPALRWLRRRLVPKSMRNAVKAGLSMRERPELDAKQVAMLEDLFDDDLAMLGKKLGVDLTCRNFKETVKSNVLDWRRR